MAHEVAYNACYGGFGLSREAVLWLEENGREEIKKAIKKLRAEYEEALREGTVRLTSLCPTIEDFVEGSLCSEELQRHDEDLIKCIKALGEKANTMFSRLRIDTIEGNMYRIEEYDGLEHVIEPTYEYFVTIH